jgi:hypothetical protein
MLISLIPHTQGERKYFPAQNIAKIHWFMMILPQNDSNLPVPG